MTHDTLRPVDNSRSALPTNDGLVSATDALSPASLGERGELIAMQYLESIGCEVLARNWRCVHGELDLVVREGGTVVAVEVKTRRGLGFGHPLESITARKVARLRVLLTCWAEQERPHAQRLRVDGVGVLLLKNQAPSVEHLRGIS